MKRAKKDKELRTKDRKDDAAAEQAALALRESDKPERPAPRPLTLADLRLEVLKRAGFDEKTLRKAVTVLNELMDGEDAHARLGAARTAFSLANVVPSKNDTPTQKVQVEVTMKPFARAQVVDAETLK